MSRSDVEHDLEEIKRFLEKLERHPKLAKSTDPELQKLATEARHFAHELDHAIDDVHRHWEKR